MQSGNQRLLTKLRTVAIVSVLAMYFFRRYKGLWHKMKAHFPKVAKHPETWQPRFSKMIHIL